MIVGLRLLAFGLIFFIAQDGLAQVRGSIFKPAAPATNPMDPNGDGYITKTGAAFTGLLDETEFEIPFKPLPQYQQEPGDDNDFTRAPCDIFELVNDPALGAESAYYYHSDPDRIPNNGDELVLFRFRAASWVNGSVSFSILIDTDNKFGFTGPSADPNAMAGNPGFELEVAYIRSGTVPNSGVHVYNVDGTNQATVLNAFYPMTSHFQAAYALNQSPSCSANIPIFTDIYLPFSALGISSTASIRMVAASADGTKGTLNGLADDIGGVDGKTMPSHDDQFTAAINAQTPVRIVENLPPVANDATVSLPENSPNGSAVHSIIASDPDPGNTLTYSIVAGNTSTAFAINAATGAITVANIAGLNYETTPSFSLTVRATDGSLFDDAVVTVNITNVNEAPVANDATISLAENSANGSSVYTVVASDVDAATTLTYSIISGNTSSAFAINSATGAITVNNSASLNFETSPSFGLTVRVSDGTLFDDALITINLTNINEAPVGTDATVALAENSGNGTTVHTIGASDVDAGTVLTYTITSGNTNNTFAVSGTGVISVNDQSAANFEITPTFTLIVRVSDGTLFHDVTVTVNLTNVNEAPVANDATISLAENSANGSSVYTVVASDVDAATTIAYSIIGGNTSSAFAINSATGAITVNNSAAQNFETNPSFGLTVRVSDGTLFDDALVTINLTNVNEAPIGTDATVALAENTTDGATVHTVTASDVDAGTVLTYTITAGNTNSAFTVGTTGVIKVNNQSALNYEVTPSFALNVRVSDGTLFDDVTVTVNLTNVNEAPVAIDAAVSLAENSANASSVHTVVASDVDAATTLTYSIISGNTSSAFAINSGTGAITVNNSASLNFETSPSFGLTVRVSDGTLFDDALVTVNLTNVNEAPIGTDATVALAENTPNGTTVHSIAASDVDTGTVLSYTITAGNTNNTFAVSGTGVISVNDQSAANFEITPTFTLNVRVSDGTLFDDVTVTVNLTNVNEAPVAIDATVSLAENSASASSVHTVVASDVDAATTIAYSIIGGNTSSAFAINSATGAITVNNSAPLNFETNPSFGLTVRVSDGTLFDDALVTINLTNINEAPVGTDATVALAENSGNGTTVHTIAANDVDAGTVLTYTITGGNTNSAFSVSTAGVIKVNNQSALNYEVTPSFALNVRVSDGTLFDDVTVAVNLTNVNEAPVAIDATVSLPENSANASSVHTVVASDVDAATTLTYSIISGNTSSAFAINSATGAITVNNSASLNFETSPSFALTVRVSDGTLFDDALVTINLTNINEAPVGTDATVSLAENTANGTTVHTIAASDVDAGTVLTYTITSGNTNSAFTVGTTGVIKVNNQSALNYEVTPSFTLNVRVSDGTLFDDVILTVNLTNVNEAPVAIDATVSLAENSANASSVHTVVASDVDAATTLTYSIISGNTSSAFSINSGTGAITVNNSASLNFETSPSFALTVRVSDGTLFDDVLVTINLTNINEPPVGTDATVALAENTPNGTTVHTIGASDVDAGTVLTYTITAGNTNSAFTVGTTGVIKVNNQSALNYEVTPSFALNVHVSDGTLFDDVTVTVNLTNVNEAPVAADATVSLVENSSSGTSVHSVIASDVDATTTLTYSIISGNTSSAFAINGATGAIRANTSAALNFETNPSFALTIRASDGTLFDDALITINLTNVNEPPVATDATVALAENAANATSVHNIGASDEDPGTVLTYTITSGNTNNAFAVDASGKVSVNNQSALNFEVTPSFTLNVRVSDGTLFDDVTVNVNLTNVNEAPIAADATVSLAENSSSGTSVHSVIASDVDATTTLTYSIISGNTSSAFAINGATGAIRVNTSAALNFETNPSFALTIRASDGTLFDDALITINLTNVNEPPVATDATVALAENAANATSVHNIAASDFDPGTVLTYTITSGNTNNAFAVDASGKVSVNNQSTLNFEVTPSFTLNVRVSDGTLFDDVTVKINLTNVNEAPIAADATLSLAENSSSGTSVHNVVASDVDAATTLTYSIVSGNTGSAFTINSTTGAINVNNSAALDFETSPVFRLNVRVSDGTLLGNALITINLTNVDEAPVGSDATVSIPENSPNGTQVHTILANAIDLGTLLTFPVVSGNTGDAFAINTSGLITVNNSSVLDFETNSSFPLIVRVSDGLLFDDVLINIKLIDVNEAPTADDATISLVENAANGTVVHTIAATDTDAGSVLRYEIANGNQAEAFSIDNLTGAITVTASSALDFERNALYALNVIVSDGSLTDEATILINITDSNEPPIAHDVVFTINENASPSEVIGRIVASDPDAGTQLSFTIVSGNANAAFSINQTTGELYANNNSTLDFEANPSFALTVRVTDGVLYDDASINVNLVDVNESPTIIGGTVRINENSATGTVIYNLMGSDPDQNTNLTYSIIAGDANGAFDIGPNDGKISVNNSLALNFETITEFQLTVRVLDGFLYHDAIVTIELTDVNEAPTVLNSVVSLAENSPAGTRIHEIAGSDPDIGSTLSYSIIAGNESYAFTIDARGLLSVNNASVLDYESSSTHFLTVRASDGFLFSDATVTINLLNVNERPSITGGSVGINENTDPGTQVFAVTATDPDAGSTLKYSMTSGNESGAFAIDNNGRITVKNYSILNFESAPTFSLVVEVTDGALSADANVTINILDINEAPIVSDGLVDITGNTSAGTVIYNVDATDPDPADVLSFSFDDMESSAGFSIDAATGAIAVTQPDLLKRGSDIEVQLRVNVEDKGGLTASAVITIQLNKVPIVPWKGFSPDGDGVNDFWTISGIESFPSNEVKIFNRWGNLVFETRNYNNSGIVWKGESQGPLVLGNKSVVESTYYYVITVTHLAPITGFVIVKQ